MLASCLCPREEEKAHPSKFAETTVPLAVVPARGKAFAETEAATERMETIVDVACILQRQKKGFR